MDCCGKIPTIQKNWNFKNKILQLGNMAKDWFKKEPESNYLKHARRELIAVGYDLNQKEEDPDKWIVEDLFELLRCLASKTIQECRLLVVLRCLKSLPYLNRFVL